MVNIQEYKFHIPYLYFSFKNILIFKELRVAYKVILTTICQISLAALRIGSEHQKQVWLQLVSFIVTFIENDSPRILTRTLLSNINSKYRFFNAVSFFFPPIFMLWEKEACLFWEDRPTSTLDIIYITTNLLHLVVNWFAVLSEAGLIGNSSTPLLSRVFWSSPPLLFSIYMKPLVKVICWQG